MDYTRHYKEADHIVKGIYEGTYRRTPKFKDGTPSKGFMSKDVKNVEAEYSFAEALIDEMAMMDKVLREQSTTGALQERNPAVWDMDEREILALTLQAEAGGEGYEGMLAAGATVMNRVARKGYYGTDIEDVILKDGQYSAWNSATGYAKGEGGLDMSSISPSEEAYKAADDLLSGNYVDPTGGATHYYNDKVANPTWGKQGNWTRIGNHLFGSPD